MFNMPPLWYQLQLGQASAPQPPSTGFLVQSEDEADYIVSSEDGSLIEIN